MVRQTYVTLTYSPAVVMNNLGNSTTSRSTTANQVDYYKSNITPEQFFYLKSTGPSAGNISIAFQR
jgi:hypothetical protein